VGHLVYLGLEPATSGLEFLAIDVWTDDSAIEGFYAAMPPEFGALFAAPPVVAVYESSSFYQYDAGLSPDPEFAVLVRGGLAGQVPVPATTYHDIVAGGGEAAARAAGDLSHDALLATALMGSPEGAFLGLDRWNDLDAMAAFYTNPEFAAAFAPLFAAPPAVEQFQAVDWFGWGDVTAGDAAESSFWVVVRGTLAGDDLDAAQAAHDALAEGGSAPAQAAGDVAHVVFLGLPGTAAEMEFLAIDVWTTSEGIEAFYAAMPPEFGALFAAPPVVAVYESTALHQW
jgi:quinol monooxygenase YgiN